jgi:type II secretory pathway component PulC
MLRTALLVVVGGLLIGCGGSPAPKTAAPATTGAPTVTPEPTPAPSRATTTSLSRSRVRDTIRLGLGAFLQSVSVEDWPVMRQGKFYGFRIREIRADWGVDLKPGDVIVRVNGMPIEHPEEADAAMRSLDKAPSLRVDYERDGKARVLELPIVDDAPHENRAR